jgi:hypothetical protein
MHAAAAEDADAVDADRWRLVPNFAGNVVRVVGGLPFLPRTPVLERGRGQV